MGRPSVHSIIYCAIYIPVRVGFDVTPAGTMIWVEIAQQTPCLFLIFSQDSELVTQQKTW